MQRARAWFFQSNPKHYDIDAALGSVDRIWWRVPQYTGEIHVGDMVILWRSGKDAGIVGVGRVVAEPQLRSMDPAEKPFVLTDDEGSEYATRALVRVQTVPFISKEKVRAIADFQQHKIVVAPMGTVFAIEDAEWTALSQFLPQPPAALEGQDSALPPAFAWPQRAKGVLPMPGGYSAYLHSLKKVCAVVAEERPTPVELAGRLEAALAVKATAARLRESFLRKVGIISVHDGVCRLGLWTEKWLSSGDDRILVALLHGRCQFMGEMLDAARTPSSNDQLLTVANDRYGMGWDTQTQIVNRRGWLQSAGMLASADDGKVQTTAGGLSLLAELALYDPASEPTVITVAEAPVVAVSVEPPPSELNLVDAIVEAVRSSATDSAHADRFEHAVRDAFAYLGFQAERLGGAGKTDVLLDARLGADDSYRAIVDCKTSGTGSVGDAQVDWVTLAEHKIKHDAHHVVLVAPNPAGSRLFDRATQQGVTVISADDLAGLCRQHAKAPLGLDDYRALFAHGGRVDTQTVDERAEDVRRLIVLAAAVCATIRDRSTMFGRLSARDLFLILAGQPVADGTTEDELQTLLDTLASPLLGVLHGSRGDGYRVTASARVAGYRVESVAQQLATSERSD
jgi:predicted RNA-binding protein with PUA-like domain